jgi:hypothetical protein
MLQKSTVFIFALFAFVFCPVQFAHAGKTLAPIKPQVLQVYLQSAGIQSEIQPSSDTAFSHSLYIPNLKDSAVTMSFPAEGLLQGRTFELEIDGMTALATFTRDRKLEVAAGDSRIEEVEAFGAVSCILDSVFQMVDDILKNVFTLNIFGIIAAVFKGVINIISCA